MPFQELHYLNVDGTLSSPFPLQTPDELLVNAYKTMIKARCIDERMLTLQRQGAITFAMSARGEEACAVASAAALDPGDWIYPQYREAGVLFWRGFPIQQYVHQMFGDAKDLLLGRQMPNHYGSRELNVVTVSSPIGTKIPHAAGCAYAMKLQKDPHVAICYFGEGATSEGDFHAGLNFAAVRKAPAIFFCRNNQYAISTPISRQFVSDGILPKAAGYGIQAQRVDGNDFFAIYEAVKKARAECLEGKGPFLIEAMTYRLGAHSTADDPSLYRSDKEVEEWTLKCPILRLRRYLELHQLWDENKENQFLQQLIEEIQQAVEQAKATAKPPLASLVQDVYFEVPPALKTELEEIRPFFPEE